MPTGTNDAWDGVSLEHEVLVFYREYYQTGHTVPQQSQMIREMSDGEAYESEIVADPSIFNRTQVGGEQLPESIGSLFANEGLTMIAGVRANVVDEMSMINKVRLWLENDKIWFFDHCVNAIREHQIWKHRENTEGIAPGKEGLEDKNNHSCDCVKELIAEEPSFVTHAMVEIHDFDD